MDLAFSDASLVSTIGVDAAESGSSQVERR